MSEAPGPSAVVTCVQEGCTEQAKQRMFWPGRPPKPVCDRHRKMAENIGAVMGTYIHTEALPDAD